MTIEESNSVDEHERESGLDGDRGDEGESDLSSGKSESASDYRERSERERKNGERGKDGIGGERESENDCESVSESEDRSESESGGERESGSESESGIEDGSKNRRESGSNDEAVEIRTNTVLHYRLVEFVRILRSEGVRIASDGSLCAAEALAVVGLSDRDRAKAALRAVLVSDPRDFGPFDDHFPAFWDRIREATLDGGSDEQQGVDLDRVRRSDRDRDEDQDQDQDQTSNGQMELSEPARHADPGRTMFEDDSGADDSDDDTPADSNRHTTATQFEPQLGENAAERGPESTALATYSRSGRSASIGDGTSAAEPASVGASVDRIVDSIARLYGRRTERSSRGAVVDARRALRESFKTGGVIVSTPKRARTQTGARCVVLVDVSRSVLDVMDRSFLLVLLSSLAESCRSMRTFFFDTDSREVTAEVEGRSAESALAALQAAEVEWGGGTRIGDALLDIRAENPDAIDRRTAVFIISDGLETGDVSAIESGMAWVSRRAGLVLWGNPLAASSEFEPTSRGMAAALPYVDGLFALDSPASLEELAEQLERFDHAALPGYNRTT